MKLYNNIPLTLRHDLVIAAKRRLNFCTILYLPPKLQDRFGQKIIEYYFRFKSFSKNPESQAGKAIVPDVIFENDVFFPDGSNMFFDASVYERPHTDKKLSEFSNNFIPLDDLINNCFQKLKGRIKSQLIEKNVVLPVNILLVFTDSSNYNLFMEKRYSFPKDTTMIFFLCGESSEHLAETKNLLKIEKADDIVAAKDILLPMLYERLARLSDKYIPTENVFFLEDRTPIALTSVVSSGTEGCILKTHFRDIVAKIYHNENEKIRFSEYLFKNEYDIYGISMPKDLLYDKNGRIRGYLMKMAKGTTLENLIYRPEFYFPNQDFSRYDIIRQFLNRIIAINRKGLFLFDMALDNIVVSMNPDIELTLIDSDSLCNNGEEHQNENIAEFLWKILSSGLSVSQFFTPLGQKLCCETLDSIVVSAFQYSFSPNKSGRGKCLSPKEWLKIFS